MVQKRKVKAMYIVQIVCEECGKPMRCTHTLCTYPAQYCYECLNCGTMNVTDGNSAVFDIQIQITYRKDNFEREVDL